jgi:antitoxin VapB
MALSIKNLEVEQMARELAQKTGESLTQAILKALRERLSRVARRRRPVALVDQLDTIAKRCAALPVLDIRSENEILGYDAHGIPGNP